ncbi:hypothetical protein B5807_02750 [Epicoccum nigrum]|uniref:Protein AF-9 homolog n=1 Tax=Epicoccum nigrum TaxID=105696 RepID=A0A1Y2M8H2_EPING|nr:hypothetical protein B5807_02750 [Epicoccum nigrum]
MPEASAPVEDVAHDDLCPICQLLLFTPVRTQCNHVLCASCMAQWADASTTTEVEHASWDVDLEEFDPNYDPTYDLEANCPMCRTHTRAAPDHALASELEQKYPIIYAERRVEEEVERGSRVGQDGVEGIMFLIGNKHKLLRGSEDANQHDWTFFVRASRPELIQEVRVDLHPTFRPPRLVLRRPPYEVRRLGWGTFTIEVEIILKAPYIWVGRNSGTTQQSLKLPWTLDFTGRGRQGRVRGGVKRTDEGGRRLRTRSLPAETPNSDDEEDDEDYEEDDEDENMSEDEEEDISEFVETLRRR